MRTTLVAICFTAAIVLTGCIMSEKPLISASGAVMPLEAGTYRGGGTPIEMPDTVLVVRKSGEYAITKTYTVKEESKPDEKKTDLYTVRFHQLDEDHYIAQVRLLDKTATDYSYVFVHFEHDVIKFYAARCDYLTHAPRILQAYGMTKIVKKDAAGWCEAKTLNDVIAFMRDIPLNTHFKNFTTLEYVIAR